VAEVRLMGFLPPGHELYKKSCCVYTGETYRRVAAAKRRGEAEKAKKARQAEIEQEKEADGSE
jgi:hypothetical protein